MGFLTGHELTWMPEALQILRDELPNIDVMISSQYAPQLAAALAKGKVDAAFLRREQGISELAFKLLVKEPLIVILPNDHRLAALKSITHGIWRARHSSPCRTRHLFFVWSSTIT